MKKNKLVTVAKKILLKICPFLKNRKINKILFVKERKAFREKMMNSRENNVETAFLLLTPAHTNLGDHAIAVAELEYLASFLSQFNIIEVTDREYNHCYDILRKYVKKEDVVMISGGGNLGTLWTGSDDCTSEIIKTYSQNKMMIFPQTCFYDDTKSGVQRLEKNKGIYGQAKDLTILLRDERSYDFCKTHFTSNTVFFTPDMVLSLDKTHYNLEREGCLFCLRTDHEKIISDESFGEVQKELDRLNLSYDFISNLNHVETTPKNRDYELDKHWRKIAGTRLLITDRLHGMIFAAITGTPCLALDNLSKKVSGVYHWIESLEYIHVCSSPEELISLIPEYSTKVGGLEGFDLKDDFDVIRKVISSERDKDS